MRKVLIMTSTALAILPVIGLAAVGAAAPVFADTPAQGPACVSQSLNPHPTDPAGGATAALFCTSPTPNPNGTGSGSGGSGSSGAGSGYTGAKTGNASTAGSGQTSLASSTGSGTAASTPDESMRFNWASDNTGATTASGKPATTKGVGLFGSLVSFFSTVGGLVALFGLLLLLILVLAAVAVMGWLRPGQNKNWSSRLSRLTFRA